MSLKIIWWQKIIYMVSFKTKKKARPRETKTEKKIYFLLLERPSQEPYNHVRLRALQKPVNYYCITLHLRCLLASWLRLCVKHIYQDIFCNWLPGYLVMS